MRGLCWGGLGIIVILSACNYSRVDTFSATELSVVDETGAPVVGAEVIADYGHRVGNLVDSAGYHSGYHATFVTDEKGLVKVPEFKDQHRANLVLSETPRKSFMVRKRGYLPADDESRHYDSARCIRWAFDGTEPWDSEYSRNTYHYCFSLKRADSAETRATARLRKVPTCAAAFEQLMNVSDTDSRSEFRDLQLASFCAAEWNAEIRKGRDLPRRVRDGLDGDKNTYSKNFYDSYLSACALGYLEPKDANHRVLREYYDRVKTYRDGGNAGHLRDLAFLSMVRLSGSGEDLRDITEDYRRNCIDSAAYEKAPGVADFVRRTCAEKAEQPEQEITRFESDSPCAYPPK